MYKPCHTSSCSQRGVGPFHEYHGLCQRSLQHTQLSDTFPALNCHQHSGVKAGIQMFATNSQW